MTDRSSVAFRIMGGRKTLLGVDNSLEAITTTELDAGALCYVEENDTHYSLNRRSTAPPNPPTVIKPRIGPGRWTVATGGTQGAQGFQGGLGAQGFQGATGTGSQGNQGAQGATGNQGSGGGAQGAQGAVGSQGAQGSLGAQGNTGLQGAQGFQGSNGAQGSSGSQGSQGAQGAIGSQGAQGATGLQGLQGAQGTQGAGFQGAQGATGNQGAGGGAQGAQGATGTQGAQGAQGTQGAGFQGAQGATGTQGNQGAQGAAGLQGNQGAQGAVGTQGAQGFQGHNGAQGLQGFQGAIGNQGFQGATGTGSQGAQGNTGTQGTAGAQGSQGATGTGLQGSQGAQGATGLQGTQGSQGFQGARGLQGFQGFQGNTGLQGAQGSTGAQGLTGSQGAQGATGVQGSQGFQGGLGTQGAAGSQGSQGGVFGPLNQYYYVDATNAGAQTGSIAQPYVSIVAALTARTTSDITLAVAPGSYAGSISITGNRNVAIVGLCAPTDQSVTIGNITMTHSAAANVLTLQNLLAGVVVDGSTSSVSQVIEIIDCVVTGTILGSGTTANETIVRLGSVLGGTASASMQVAAIQSVYQVLAANAIINGVFSASNGGTTDAAMNTFRGCVFTVAPTTGPLQCFDTTFQAGLTTSGTGSKNYFYGCTIDGDIAQGAGSGDQVFIWDGRLSTNSNTTSMAIGNLSRLELRATKFGPKSSGHINVGSGLSPGLFMDAESEKSFWKDGIGRIAIGASNGVFTSLTAGEVGGQVMQNTNITADPTVAMRFVIPNGTAITGGVTLNLVNSGAPALADYYVDNYGASSPSAVNVQANGVAIMQINSFSPNPARFRFTTTSDGLTIVYNGVEVFGG